MGVCVCVMRLKKASWNEAHTVALKLHYKVASSHLPAPQIAPRTQVVLPSRQFSSSSSPATPRTTVALQSRQSVLIFQLPRYSAYSSCTTKSPVLIFPLPSYYSCTTKSPVLIFQLPSYSAYYSCTTKSPVPSFQLHRLLRVLKLYYKVASSQLPAPQLLRVLQFYYKDTSSHLPATYSAY